MKKILSILLVLIGLNKSFSQELDFRVDYSKNYATFEFLRYISEHYPENNFKSAFENSSYYNEEYRNLVKTFNNINYFYWYEYEQYPYGNKIGGSTYFLLGRNLIESETINEFRRKSFGIIPSSDLEMMSDILSEFKLVYNELVYEPNKNAFNRQLSRLSELIEQTDMSATFDKIFKFHNSSWDANVPFKVTFYPNPFDSNRFTATAFFNYAVGSMPLDFENYELLLSVVFHEACHIIYDEQSLAFKKKVDSWFNQNSSNSSQYAKLLFNEAITTSLANGYLYREFKGELLPSPWYNNTYISEMSEDIFPKVEEYLAEDKQIDKEFIDYYISAFENKHSDWLNNIEHLMMNRSIITDSINDYRELNKFFRYNNLEEKSDEISPLSLVEMKSHPITKVIVVSSDNARKLDLIKNNFSEFSEWKPNAGTDFQHTVFLSDKTYLIVINRINQSLEEHINQISVE